MAGRTGWVLIMVALVQTGEYFVYTWDAETQRFTPQEGVHSGPYTKWGLRQALRTLQAMGYDASRHDFSILVERGWTKVPVSASMSGDRSIA